MELVKFIIFTTIVISTLYTVKSQNTTGNSDSQTVTTGTSDELSPLEKGVQTLYEIVHNFLDQVQKEDFFDSETSLNFTTLEDIVRRNDYKELQDRWQDLAAVFTGFAACIIIGLLFVVAMPIAGCIWCCCYCCCKTCGKTKEDEDPPHAKCKRSTCCMLLFLFAVMVLAGAVVAAISNEILHQKLENNDNRGPVGKLNTSFIDLKQYAEKTVVEIQTSTNTTLQRTVSQVKSTIKGAVNTTVDKVQATINSDALLTQVETIGNDANTTSASLNDVATHLGHINTLNSEIQVILSGVEGNITQVCNTVPTVTSNCPNVTGLAPSTDFSQVQDLQNIATNVADTLSIGNLATDARTEFENVRNNVTAKIDKNIQDSLTQVDNITADVQSKLDEVNKTVQPFVDSINKEVEPKLTDLDKWLKEYGDYWWYVGIGVSCLILLVVLFYLMSILFGVFGERPGHGAHCCNRGAASNFIVAGVICSFLFAWIFMFLVIILFTLGGMSYTMLCRYVNSGVENVGKYEAVINDIGHISLKKTLYGDANVDITIGSVLTDCKNNMALYSALKLQNKFDLEALLNTSQVTAEVDKIRSSQFVNDIGNISIIPPNLENSLKDFSNSGIATINFTQYDEQMNKENVITFNINATITSLQNLENQLTNAGQTPENNTVKEQRLNLELIRDSHIPQLKKNITGLQDSLQSVRDKTNIINETDKLVHDLRAAEEKFNTEGKIIVNTTMQSTLDNITDYIVRETKDLVKKVTNDTGHCKPVYDAAQAITDFVCSVVLDPFNGFWFGIGWALFFYIPCIIFGLCLANLYQRKEPYDKEEARRRKREDFDTPDMDMYHGGGGYNGYHGHGSSDNIPLTSVDRNYGGAGGRQNGVPNAGYDYNKYGGDGGRYRDNDMYYRNGETQGYTRPPSYHEDMSHYPPPQHGINQNRQYY